jgi:hypothetical protein
VQSYITLKAVSVEQSTLLFRLHSCASLFSGAFAKLRKAAVSFVMSLSVRPLARLFFRLSVRMEKKSAALDGF